MPTEVLERKATPDTDPTTIAPKTDGELRECARKHRLAMAPKEVIAVPAETSHIRETHAEREQADPLESFLAEQADARGRICKETLGDELAAIFGQLEAGLDFDDEQLTGGGTRQSTRTAPAVDAPCPYGGDGGEPLDPHSALDRRRASGCSRNRSWRTA